MPDFTISPPAASVLRLTGIKKRFGAKSLEGLTVPADGMASDIHGSAEYRAHLIGVQTQRAVKQLAG